MEVAEKHYNFDYLLVVEDDMRASDHLAQKLQALLKSSYLGRKKDWVLTKLYYSEQLQANTQIMQFENPKRDRSF